MDNGPEFVSRSLDLWAYWNGVELDFSRPGKPTDNAFIESFNGKFREECLNQHWFLSLAEAQELFAEAEDLDGQAEALGSQGVIHIETEDWDQAQVQIERQDSNIVVEIEDFISPTIVERLEMDTPLFKAQIPDWRAMVDVVLIDTAYDGEVFNIALSDVPEKKNDLVSGHYELPALDGPTTVAVKIIDMLGEEVLVTADV